MQEQEDWVILLKFVFYIFSSKICYEKADSDV